MKKKKHALIRNMHTQTKKRTASKLFCVQMINILISFQIHFPRFYGFFSFSICSLIAILSSWILILWNVVSVITFLFGLIYFPIFFSVLFRQIPYLQFYKYVFNRFVHLKWKKKYYWPSVHFYNFFLYCLVCASIIFFFLGCKQITINRKHNQNKKKK